MRAGPLHQDGRSGTSRLQLCPDSGWYAVGDASEKRAPGPPKRAAGTAMVRFAAPIANP